jgi:hypothetical protein
VPDQPEPSREGPEQPQREAVSVDGWWRALAAIAGTAGLGAGGYAVFGTKSEAGPVALLAVGSIFALIAMGGVLPRRIKVGQAEVKLERLSRKYETTTDALAATLAANPDSPTSKQVMQQLDVVAPEAAEKAERAVDFERRVLAAIAASARRLGLQCYTEPVNPLLSGSVTVSGIRQPHIDAILASSTSPKRVIVEVKAVATLASSSVGQAHLYFNMIQPLYSATDLLIITPTTGHYYGNDDRAAHLYVRYLNPADLDQSVEAMLRELFDQAATGDGR